MKLHVRSWFYWSIFSATLVWFGALGPVFGQTGGNRVTYAGGTGNEQFEGMLALSDGTILVGGQADNFSWIPGGVPVNTISNVSRYFSASSQGTGFILRLSADQQTILGVLRFPDNSVRNVYKIKTNSLPGQPTGDIFISGSRDTTAAADGYYIARLNNNFLNGLPTGVAYYKSIDGRSRNGGGASIQYPAGSESAVKTFQPWDVNSKGQILYATGADFSFDRSGISFMNREGVDTLMNYFSVHSPGFTGVPASSFVNTTGNPAFDLRNSSLWFKYTGTGTPGAFRSYTPELYNQLNEDENGNPGRKGAFPFDAFFASHQALGGAPITGQGTLFPGYTGYSYNAGGGRWTAKVGGIVFDRRDNTFYIGASASVNSLSNISGLDDAESAVAAFSPTGELRWWARLHKEDANHSPAQQHVEGLDIDYGHNQLVVLGRTRGNSINNFWKGNELKLKLNGNGYQNQLTGDFSGSNFQDYFWLGKFDIQSGKIRHSTYVGELAANQAFTNASANPNYDGYPDLNTGNFNLGNTLIQNISVHPTTGRVYVTGVGQRTMTTRGAYQKILKPGPYQTGGGLAATNAFVRVYSSGLDSVVYSSLVTGLWNPANGTSNNTVLRGLLPLDSGLIFSGGIANSGEDVYTLNTPAWGTGERQNGSALFGQLRFFPSAPPAQPDTIRKPADFCAGTEFTFSIPPVPGATAYRWVVEANGWSGTSTTNTITLTRTVPAFAGFLTVYAVNASGISLARTTNLPGTATVSAPAAVTFPPSHCPNQTLNYQVNSVNNAISYNWTVVGDGCAAAWTLSSATTASNVVQLTMGSTVVSPCSLQVVANGCTNSSSPVSFVLPLASDLPAAPSLTEPFTALCNGIPKTISVVSGPQDLEYVWNLTGTGYSGTSSGNSYTVVSEPGSNGGQLSIAIRNACGLGPATVINLGNTLAEGLPTTPATIVGPNSGFCSNDTIQYSVAALPGTTYRWTTNGNLWEVLDPNEAQTRLYIPQTGSSVQAVLFVQAFNQCGTSSPIGLPIRRGAPDIPGAERIIPALDSGICAGATVNFSINPTFAANSYSWTLPAGWIVNGPSDGPVVNVTVGPAAEAGFIKVKAANTCGSDSVQRISPTIKTNSATFSVAPAPGGTITLCAGASRLAYIEGSFVGGVGSFQWILPPGVFVINAGTQNPSNDTVRISSSAEAQSGPITVVLNGNQCGTATVSLSITPNPAPGVLSGANQLCVNPSDQVYTIQSVPGATSYQFEIQPPSAGTLSVTDTTVSVNWADAFTGSATIRARAVSSCGPSPFGPSFAVSVGLPNATAQAPSGICGPGEVVFQASGAGSGSQYAWYTSSSGGSPVATNAGSLTVQVTSDTTLYVSVTNGLCESLVRTPVSVSLLSNPAAPVAVGDTICAAGSVSLTASGGGTGITYQWYGQPNGGTALASGTGFSTNISASQTFYVSASNGACEGPRTEVSALIQNNTSSPAAQPDTLCAPGQVSLVASGGGTGVTYSWFDVPTGGTALATGATFQPTVSATTTYYVSSSDGNCESPRTSVQAVIGSNLSAPTSADQNLCSAASVTLTASGATSAQTYLWYASATGGTSVFTGASYTPGTISETDTFYVSIQENACESSRTRVIVRVAAPLANAATTPVTLCGSGQASLTATGAGAGQNYAWYTQSTGGSPVGTGSPFQTSVTTTTTFYAVVTDGPCESLTRQPLPVTVNIPPAAPGVNNASICGSAQVTLTGTSPQPGAVFEWYSAETGGTLLFTGNPYTPTVATTTTFYVQVQGPASCNSPRTASLVSVSPAPGTPQSTGNVSRCGPGTVDLQATLAGAGTLSWFEQQTGGTAIGTGSPFTTPSLSASTTYYVGAVLGTCESPRVAVQVQINEVPSQPTGADVSRCGPGSVTLNAAQSGGFALNWYDQPSGGSILFTGTAFSTPAVSVTTSYYVSSTLGTCEGPRLEVKAVINPAIPVPTSQDVTRCGAGTVDLTAVGVEGSVINWYDAETGGNLLASGPAFTTASLSENRSFFVSAAANGCESNRVEVRVFVLPAAALPNGNDVSRCGPGTATLTVTGTAPFTWYDAETGGNELATGASFTTPNLSTETSYYVSAGSGACVSARRQIRVRINAVPEAPASTTQERCGPGSISLTTSSPGISSFRWYTALNGGSLLGNSATFTTDVTESRFFFAASVNDQGCESPRTLCRANVVAIPVPNATATPAIIKPGEVSNLTASGGGTYSWSPSATLRNPNTANPVADPTVTTTYVVVVSVRGCEGRDTVTVQVDGGGNTIPNVFTPGNNDNIGDTWVIPGALSNPGNQLRIFNRWGTLVKEVNGYKNDWDGDNLPAGTYYYTYNDGKSTVTGTVTLVR